MLMWSSLHGCQSPAEDILWPRAQCHLPGEGQGGLQGLSWLPQELEMIENPSALKGSFAFLLSFWLFLAKE